MPSGVSHGSPSDGEGAARSAARSSLVKSGKLILSPLALSGSICAQAEPHRACAAQYGIRRHSCRGLSIACEPDKRRFIAAKRVEIHRRLDAWAVRLIVMLPDYPIAAPEIRRRIQ